MSSDLYYEEYGYGFPLILLHGNGEDHTYFSHQFDYFKSKYRVIAIDTRGHGMSPRGTADLTIKRAAVDLYDFLIAHNIEKAHLLGFSDGGNIALEFALDHPRMAASLVLNGANLDPAGVKRSVQFPIEVGYKMASFFASKCENAKLNAEILGLMVNEPHISPEELKKLNIPTLVIAGTRDMIKRSHTELIASCIPGAKLQFIKGDHFIANKVPDAFNRAVDDFLAGIDPRDADKMDL